MEFDSPVQCIAFSLDGKFLAAGTAGLRPIPTEHWQGMVGVYDVPGKKIVTKLPQPRRVLSVAFSPDSKLLAIGTGSHNDAPDPDFMGYKPAPGEVVVYSVPDFKERHRYTAEKGAVVRTVAFHPKGNALFALIDPMTGGEAVMQWSLPDFKEGYAIREPRRQYTAFALTPDGESILVTDTVGFGQDKPERIEIFDTATGKHRRTLTTPRGDITSQITVAPDAKFAVLENDTHSRGIRRVSLADGKFEDWPGITRFEVEPGVMQVGGNAGGATAFSRGGKLFAETAAIDGYPRYAWVAVWGLETDKKAYWESQYGGTTVYHALAFSPNAELLAAGGSGGEKPGLVVLWHVPALK